MCHFIEHFHFDIFSASQNIEAKHDHDMSEMLSSIAKQL